MQSALVVPDQVSADYEKRPGVQCADGLFRNLLVGRRSSARVAFGTLRCSEWVIFTFLVYAASLACILPVAQSVRDRIAVVNVAVIVVYAILIRRDYLKPALALSVIRDWLPLALVLLAYREMGWFALPHHGHLLESYWVVWDRAFLRGGGRAVIEALGPVIPSILEIAYALVYALAPFSVAVLYLYGHRNSVDRFLFVFVIGVLLCYVQFPFWPSEPPRVVFFGQDFPTYDTIFRRFNLWTLGNYGIHTSVFPSAHVAGAFSAAFGMRVAMPEHKWVYRFLGVVAVLIAAATVYGRYHYLADASAGFLIAVLVVASRRHLVATASRLNRAVPIVSQRRITDYVR
jgi:membrane-associated phospholipid phosphatase